MRLNVAETVVAAVTDTVQVRDDPAHPPPLQPEKTKPLLLGVALSVTSVLTGYAAEQTEPQLMPAGVLVTVPGPETEMLRGNVDALKLAVTVIEVLPVTVQGAVPAQPPPLQPVKEPAVGVAVRVTVVPAG